MQVKDMTKGNELKLIFLFSLPLMLGNIFQQLYTVCDTIIVSRHLGVKALAAVGCSDWLTWMGIAVVTGLAQGFSIPIAHAFGTHEKRNVQKCISTLVVNAIISTVVLLAVIYPLLPNILILLKTPADIMDRALAYTHVIYIGLFATMFYNALTSILRAFGNSKTPLQAMIIASICNVGLDVLFVMGLEWGIIGAGVATVIAQGISTIICFFLIWKDAKILIPKKEHFHMESSMINDLLGQGFSMGFMFSIVSIGTIILQTGINGLGTQIIAAHTAARKLMSLLCLPLSTLAASMATFVSQNKGAQNYTRIMKGVRMANTCGIIYPMFLSIIIYFTAENLVHFLSGSSNPIVLENGAMYLKINVPFFIVLSILLNLRNTIQGFGYKITPLISSLIEFFGKIVFTLFLVPTFKYLGVCFCEPIIWCMMASQLLFSYHRIIKPFKAQN